MTPARDRCHARTKKGDRCRNPAGPDGLCPVHRRQVVAADRASRARLLGPIITRTLIKKINHTLWQCHLFNAP